MSESIVSIAKSGPICLVGYSDIQTVVKDRGEVLTIKEMRRAGELTADFMDWKHAVDLAIDVVLEEREEAS